MVDKLLEDVQDKNIPLSNLLRRAKVVASRLDRKDLLKWLDKELNGYDKKENVPDYRMVSGQVKAWNPYHGWIPVIMRGDWAIMSTRGVSQSVSELEALTSSDSTTLQMPFPDSLTAQMIKDPPLTKSALFIGTTAIVGILNLIRNKLFDWLLELDKQGVKIEDTPTVSVITPSTFDEGASTLTVNGQGIEISKSKDSDPHYLLVILFREPDRDWAYDEVWEDPYFIRKGKEYDPKTDWRKVYNAAYSVNEKVAKATTLDDFLTVTKTSVAINKKYL